MRKALYILISMLLVATALYVMVGMGCSPPSSRAIQPLVLVGEHDIALTSHSFDGTYSTWTYQVTSGAQPSLSHWTISWCDREAVVAASETWEYVDPDPRTGIIGIKFDQGYDAGETRTVWFRLLGDYPQGWIEVVTFAGTEVHSGLVQGPLCEPVPITCRISVSPDAVVCAGTEVALVESGGDAVAWLWTTGATTQSITVTESGTYGVHVTDAHDHSSYCEVQITVAACPVCYACNVSTGQCEPVPSGLACGHGDWEPDPGNPCQERRGIHRCDDVGDCSASGEYEYRQVSDGQICGYGAWEDDPANACQERRAVHVCSDGSCAASGSYEYRNKADGTVCGYGAWEDDPDNACHERRAIHVCSDGSCVASGSYEYRNKADGTVCGYGAWEDDPDNACHERRSISICSDGSCVISGTYEYRDRADGTVCGYGAWEYDPANACQERRAVHICSDGSCTVSGSYEHRNKADGTMCGYGAWEYDPANACQERRAVHVCSDGSCVVSGSYEYRDKPDGTACGYGAWEDDPDNACRERSSINICSDGSCVISGTYEYRDRADGTVCGYGAWEDDPANVCRERRDVYSCLSGGCMRSGGYVYRNKGPYVLTVASSGSPQGGSVVTPGEGTFSYGCGAVVGLVVIPADGYRFANWTGDVGTIVSVDSAATTIAMNSNCSIIANFMREYELTVDSTPGGSVTLPGEGTFTYGQGTAVNLVAEPAEGYRFVQWTGDIHAISIVNAASTTITMDGNYRITARFERGVGGPGIRIMGVTRGVDGAILSGAAVTLYLNGEAMANVVSDEIGRYYALVVSGLGDYDVMVSNEGFGDEAQPVSVNELATYTVDFVGSYGLIPDAPDTSYVLACISLANLGEPPLQLSTSKLLQVISVWLYGAPEA